MGLFKKLQDAVVPTDPEAVAAQQRAMGIDTASGSVGTTASWSFLNRPMLIHLWLYG